MTEAEWFTATDPEPSLRFLRGRVSDRKLRLFGVECCRGVYYIRHDPTCRRRLEVIEQYAEGVVTIAGLLSVGSAAWDDAASFDPGGPFGPEVGSAEWNDWEEKGAAHKAVAFLATRPTPEDPLVLRVVDSVIRTREDYEYVLRPLLHDIVGNPFHPVTLDPIWLTSTVVLLARGIYEERAFDRMPILADALQDAGCDNEDILDHCREEDTRHVRGCWVVDLILGKA